MDCPKRPVGALLSTHLNTASRSSRQEVPWAVHMGRSAVQVGRFPFPIGARAGWQPRLHAKCSHLFRELLQFASSPTFSLSAPSPHVCRNVCRAMPADACQCGLFMHRVPRKNGPEWGPLHSNPATPNNWDQNLTADSAQGPFCLAKRRAPGAGCCGRTARASAARSSGDLPTPARRCLPLVCRSLTTNAGARAQRSTMREHRLMLPHVRFAYQTCALTT